MIARFALPCLILVITTSPITLAQPPGMGGEDRKLLDEFDADKNGWLNNEERKQARAFIKENPSRGRGPGGGEPGGGGRGFGGPGFGGPGGGPGFGGPGFGGPGFGGPGGGPGFGGPPGFGRGERPEGDGPPPGGRDGFGPSSGPRSGRDRGDARGSEGPGRGPGFGGRGGFEGPGGRGPGGFGGPGGRGPGGRGPGGRGPGGGPGRGGNRPEATKGKMIEKSSVSPDEGDLYDTGVLRTIFIDFENADWESELEDFHGTDIDVVAEVTVDRKTYAGVGIHFRGASSYGMVPAGYKRSLNLSLDTVDDDQRLLGYKTLNLLNGSSDDSLMSTVLYSHIARQHLPTPKANFVRVVINGENWGVYTNVQQFNKDFLKENYDSSKGARWKVAGSPRGGGGLDYRGDDPSNYQHPYEQKSGGKKSLAKLIELCRVLDQTPAEKLPEALEPICDVDELLWFLAIDNGLINSDGYWVRASDYSIFLDKKDKFHFIPHDMNEAFRAAGGPGMGDRGGRGRGGPGRGGPGGRPDENRRGDRREGGTPQLAASPVGLDPLIGMDDPTKPLRSKVLAVPKYRQQYLRNVRELAEKSLDWNSMGPFVAKAADLIDDAVKNGTRKLGSYEAFVATTSDSPPQSKQSETRGGHGAMNLKAFADARREYLLKATESVAKE